MIQLIGGQMQQIFNADIAYVALLDPQTNLIHFPYQVSETFDTPKAGRRADQQDHPDGQAAAQ
jgi:hypothetical protein